MEVQNAQPVHDMEGPLRMRVVVQPDEVQVKRVGRASTIEPEIKVCIESDIPNTIVLNAYLKVLGKDAKHKMILLRKSDEISFSKTHRKEIVSMKLRFLKTMKVQVLKRNLGVSRPEASIVFEAVNRQGMVEATTSTTNFAIISDPRYLEEVKKRRALEHHGEEDVTANGSDEHHIKRASKRRRVPKLSDMDYGEEYVDYEPHEYITNYEDMQSTGTDTLSRMHLSALTHPTNASSSSISPLALPPLKSTESDSDHELYTDSDEEEYALIQLVQSLKRQRGCDCHPHVPVSVPVSESDMPKQESAGT